MGAADKRAHEREAVRYPVRMRLADGRELEGTIENIGSLGAFVTTIELEPLINVGDRVSVTIAVSETGPKDASGEVLRAEQEFAEGEIRRTFAVRFDEPVDL